MVNSPVLRKKMGKGKDETLLETRTGGTTILMTSDPKKAETSSNPIVQGTATIRQGGVPHNEVITETIDEMEEIVAEESRDNPTLSAQGRKLAKDLVSMGEATKKLVSEKNYDEAFQSAIASTTIGMKELSVEGEMLSVETEEMKIESQKMLNSVKELTLKFVTSGELREITGEILDLFKSLWYYSKLPEKLEKVKESLAETIGIPIQENIGTQKKFDFPKSEILIPGFETPSTKEEVPQPLWSESFSPTEQGITEEEFVDKFRAILLRISSKDEFQDVIQHLRTINFIMKRREEMHSEHFDTRPFKDASRVFRRFVDDREFRKFKTNFWDLWEDIRHDEEMDCFFHDCYRFTQKTFQDKNYLNSELFKKDALDLMHRGRALTFQNKYYDRFSTLVLQGHNVLSSIKNDPTLSEFQSSVEKFAKDFGLYGPKGQPDLLKMTTGIDQLRLLLVPVMRKMLENIPLSRVEIYNPTFNMMVDDLYLDGADILPEFFRMKIDDKIEADLRLKGGPSHNRTRLWVEVSGMKPKFRHFKFAYNRKTFPKLDDQGMANLFFKGNGCKIVLVWEVHSDIGSGSAVAKLKNCKCIIDSIDIQILEAEKHSWFDQMAASWMQGSLKRKLSAAIEEFLCANIDPLNQRLNDFFYHSPLEKFYAPHKMPLST